MKQLGLCSALHKYNDLREFVDELKPDENDLIITCSYIHESGLGAYNLKSQVIYQDKYGVGEPSDEMIEKMIADIDSSYKRVIGIGGGTVLDISKLFALKNIKPLVDLFKGNLEIEKKCPLVLVPTTCGTGSEVTNVAIVGFPSLNTKLRLAVDELYADMAVFVPELLNNLPQKVFAASAIDALIHAIESGCSPLSTEYSRLFGDKAIQMIIEGFAKIRDKGDAVRCELYEQFLIASNFAGIAFGQAGCGAVHAMSYPLSGKYHVAHGEANYVLLGAVLKKYFEKDCSDRFDKTMSVLALALGCDESRIVEELIALLEYILPYKKMSDYGTLESDLDGFVEIVEKYQGVIMSHNPTVLSTADIMDIYKNCL